MKQVCIDLKFTGLSLMMGSISQLSTRDQYMIWNWNDNFYIAEAQFLIFEEHHYIVTLYNEKL